MKQLRSMVEVLSQDELQAIHEASLGILERTGVRVPHEGCLEKTRRDGAVVDRDRQVMRLPAAVIEEFVRGLRAAAAPVTDPLVRGPIHGDVSTQVHVVDYATRTRRPGTSSDILKGIALVEQLSNIPRSNAVCLPSEVDPIVSDLRAHLLLHLYARKPGGTYILSPRTAPWIMDLSEAVGRRQTCLVETVSPLAFRRETLEIALAFAERRHHLAIAPMVMAGTTAPATLAGACTLMNAEILASLFVCRALSGETPRWYVHGSHAADPGTLLCSFGSPAQSLLGIATAQLGAFYGLASGSNSGLSDSLLPDFQCGMEKLSSALFSCLAGTVAIGCQGIAGADQGFSFEQLVLDDEWIDAYNFVAAGFTADRDAIAEDLIGAVGIGGAYVEEPHTAEHLRESWWRSRLFQRVGWDVWKSGDGVTCLQRAHQRVEELTAGWERMPLAVPGGTADELRRIAEEGERGILAGR
jgi:trimethylamine---corrinoid protein Co-methyltransferase